MFYYSTALVLCLICLLRHTSALGATSWLKNVNGAFPSATNCAAMMVVDSRPKFDDSQNLQKLMSGNLIKTIDVGSTSKDYTDAAAECARICYSKNEVGAYGSTLQCNIATVYSSDGRYFRCFHYSWQVSFDIKYPLKNSEQSQTGFETSVIFYRQHSRDCGQSSTTDSTSSIHWFLKQNVELDRFTGGCSWDQSYILLRETSDSGSECASSCVANPACGYAQFQNHIKTCFHLTHCRQTYNNDLNAFVFARKKFANTIWNAQLAKIFSVGEQYKTALSDTTRDSCAQACISSGICCGWAHNGADSCTLFSQCTNSISSISHTLYTKA